MHTGANTTPADPKRAAHEARRERLISEFHRARDAGRPIRLKKATSNLFRDRRRADRASLDVRDFTHVLDVNPAEGWVDVEGMIRYETLVDALLPRGLMPAVVPELKSITVGGAISGGGIESSSFRHGFVHETVLEMDILTGAGEIVICRPDNAHADLFFGFPCSYGALGYCLRARIRTMPTRPFVHLRHQAFSRIESFVAEMMNACRAGRTSDGKPAFIDGTAFSDRSFVLTTGTWSDEAPRTSDYTGDNIYHRSLREKSEDWLTVKDYLWRWDTDWFWCSRAFGAEHPVLRRVYKSLGLLRSTAYWKIKAFLRRSGLFALLRLDRGVEYVIQDVEIQAERAGEFLAFLLREIGILPVWVCPAQGSEGGPRFPLYPTDPSKLYLNFGFWGGVPSEHPPGHFDRLVEAKTIELGGWKSLYSTSYFEPDTFERLYDESRCRSLKQRYDPDKRFPDRYAKCVRTS